MADRGGGCGAGAGDDITVMASRLRPRPTVEPARVVEHLKTALSRLAQSLYAVDDDPDLSFVLAHASGGGWTGRAASAIDTALNRTWTEQYPLARDAVERVCAAVDACCLVGRKSFLDAGAGAPCSGVTTGCPIGSSCPSSK